MQSPSINCNRNCIEKKMTPRPVINKKCNLSPLYRKAEKSLTIFFSAAYKALLWPDERQNQMHFACHTHAWMQIKNHFSSELHKSEMEKISRISYWFIAWIRKRTAFSVSAPKVQSALIASIRVYELEVKLRNYSIYAIL